MYKRFFTSGDVARLVGTYTATVIRWARLDLIEVVLFDSIPEYEKPFYRHGGTKPEFLYSFTSIVQAKVLKSISLQANVHAGTIKKVLDFLRTCGESPTLRDLYLIRLNNNLLWVKQNDFGDLMKGIIVMGTKKGQYEFVPMIVLDDALGELRESVIAFDMDSSNKQKFVNHIDHLRRVA